MKKRSLSVLYLFTYVLVLGVLSAYAGASAPQSTNDLKQAFGSGKKTVVFFLNPAGNPCKAQNEILQKLHADRGKNFNIVYVDANNAANKKAFYDYGVRGLPTVVIVDSAGNIGKVFSPGIQNYETLAKALDGLK